MDMSGGADVMVPVMIPTSVELAPGDEVMPGPALVVPP